MEIIETVDVSVNAHGISNDKNRIILFNSFMDNGIIMDYWRECTKNKGSNYVILRNGDVYKIADDKAFFKTTTSIVDKNAVTICIDNLGYLLYDDKKNTIVDYMNIDYCSEYEDRDVYMLKSKWKGYDMWEPYTDEQLNSASGLVISLCDKFNITKNVMSHNVKIESPELVFGVMYRSNFSRYYTDLSPAWNYQLFKSIIEENNESNDK